MDNVMTSASITVTTGALVITNRVYTNDAAAAAFSAVTGGTIAPVVTVGTGYIDVVTTVTPDTAVGIVAETPKYYGHHNVNGVGVLK